MAAIDAIVVIAAIDVDIGIAGADRSAPASAGRPPLLPQAAKPKPKSSATTVEKAWTETRAKIPITLRVGSSAQVMFRNGT